MVVEDGHRNIAVQMAIRDIISPPTVEQRGHRDHGRMMVELAMDVAVDYFVPSFGRATADF